MSWEDRISLSTPEGTTIDMVVAGLGSRLIARILDTLIQLAVFLAALLLLALLAATGEGGWGSALLALVAFLVLFGYDFAWEVLASGRSPGKRVAGIRVVDESGGPESLVAAAIRAMLLPIDVLVGPLMIMLHPQRKRLGDVAASTLVTRERRGTRRDAQATSSMGTWTAATTAAGVPGSTSNAAATEADPFAGWDVSRITGEEAALIRGFLDRRNTLDPLARGRLALQLARQIAPKVTGPKHDLTEEQLLAVVAAAKSARG